MLYKTIASHGGKVIVFVDGYYIDNLNLNIPDLNYLEVIYDQSILSKEVFAISSLRTFDSIKDNKLKYLLYRNKIINKIQYYAVQNVIDKDYSLYTDFVNNMASYLSSIR